MRPDDHLRRLGRQLAAVRAALLRGDDLAVERLLDLADALQAPFGPGPDQTSADRAQLIALLDEASALHDLLERTRGTLRQTIDADARRRLGRAAYRLQGQG